MKYILLLLTLLVMGTASTQAQDDNPYARFGHKGKVLKTPQERQQFMLKIPNPDATSEIALVGIAPNEGKYYLFDAANEVIQEDTLMDDEVARFLTVDPLTYSYPWYTPYQFAGNKPIKFIDLDGLEEAMRKVGTGNVIFAVEDDDIEAMMNSENNELWDIYKVKNLYEVRKATTEYAGEYGKINNFVYHDHGGTGGENYLAHAIMLGQDTDIGVSLSFSAAANNSYNNGLASWNGDAKGFETAAMTMAGEFGSSWQGTILTRRNLQEVFTNIEPGGNLIFTGCNCAEGSALGDALGQLSNYQFNIFLNADYTESFYAGKTKSQNNEIYTIKSRFFDMTLSGGGAYEYGFFKYPVGGGERIQLGGTLILNSTGKTPFSIFSGYTKLTFSSKRRGSEVTGLNSEVEKVQKDVKPKG